ncbi:MAG: prepilin peptidase, partial [Pseudomonadota bacterium]
MDYFLLFISIFQFILFIFAGASMGSFASAIIYREINNLSYFYSKGAAARSFCPHCKTQLKFADLIPLLSYVLQKGRC